MKEQLKEYLQKLFENAPHTPRNDALFEELLGNLSDHYDDLIASGAAPDVAYRTAVAELGDVSPLIEGFPSAAPRDPKEKPRFDASKLRRCKRGRGLGIAIAVGLYICSVIPAMFGDMLALLLFPIIAVATGIIVFTCCTVPAYTDDSLFRYDEKTRARDFGLSNALLSIGIVFCILCILPPAILDSAVGAAVMFAVVAIGVGCIIFASYLRPTADKKTATARTDAVISAPTAPASREKNRKKRHLWVPAVVIGFALLLSGFITLLAVNGWECSFYFDGEYISKYPNHGNAEVTGEISDVVVDWRHGDVRVVPFEGENIRFTETKNGNAVEEEDQLYWYLRDGELKIRYDEPKFIHFVFGKRNEKSLLIEVPTELYENRTLTLRLENSSGDVTFSGGAFRALEVETSSGGIAVASTAADRAAFGASSGTITCTGLTVTGELTFDSSSGAITVSDSTAQRITMEASSGTITCTGLTVTEDLSFDSSSGAISVSDSTAQRVRMDASSGVLTATNVTCDRFESNVSSGDTVLTVACREISAESSSGNLTLTLTAKPERVTCDVSSGDVRLRLPEDAGFTLRADSDRIAYISEAAREGNTYRHGDGAVSIDIDISSGSIYVNEK